MSSLPGLNLTSVSAPSPSLSAPVSLEPRTQTLSAFTEYRFEVSFARSLTVRLLSGTAEFFGSELAPSATYTFTGTKGAIYTWHGCQLELVGQCESEYVAEQTAMMSYANAHFALETLRQRALSTNEPGPRVLVVGPEHSGKTSLIKILTSYAMKMGRQPMVINLDPREGMLSVPGSLTAAAFSSIIDIEHGWGSSPISAPSPIPVKMPLVYFYGLGNTEEGNARGFKPLVTRMALAATSRMEADKLSKQSGFVIDTPGSMSQAKGGAYDNIDHIISEFSINVVFVLHSERIEQDLTRKYANRSEDPVSIVRLDKSGGCVGRDEAYMKQQRQAQIRAYFFGHGGDNALEPHSQMVDFGDLSIYKVKDASETASSSLNTDDDMHGTSSSSLGAIYEKISPSTQIQNSLLAVTTAAANDNHASIRDSSITGYVYIADVDEAKRKIRLVSPQPGHIPSTALVLGSFPEDVPGLLE